MPPKARKVCKKGAPEPPEECVIAPYEAIAVAIDHSYVSNMVLERALKLADIFSSRLVIIHVIPTILPYETKMGPAVEPSYMEFMKEDDTDVIRSAKKRLEETGVEGEVIQLEGDPAEEILGILNEKQIKLIVVGSKEKAGTLVHLGSVSKAIAERAKCSVLIERICE